MILQLCRWIFSRVLGGGKYRSNSEYHPHHSTRRLEVDHLEDRTLPSVALDPTGLQSGPSLCTCSMCCGAAPTTSTQSSENPADSAPFTFSNGTNSTNRAAKWAQPYGLGTVVTITYSFHSSVTSGLNGVTYAQLRGAVQEALSLWARHAPLNFVEVPDSGPSFLEGNSYPGSNYPMIRIGAKPQDGPYNSLAYAYFPSTNGLGGDLVLDSSETWSLAPSAGRIDITEVLTHEIGHALGLGHESTSNAILNPTYGARYSGPGTAYLLPDDIAGIQTLYGGGSGAVQPGTSASPPTVQNFGNERPVIAQLYRVSLGREASEQELQNWQAAYPSLGTAGVIAGIERSPEARMRLVSQYYQKFLGRNPSGSEMVGWTQLLMRGASNESVIVGFLNSEEFYNRAQVFEVGSPDERFMRHLYNVALNRPVRQIDLDYWLGVIQRDGRAALTVPVVLSSEYRHVQIREFYNTILLRPGSATEVGAWAGVPHDLQTIREMFLASEEFTRYVVPQANLNRFAIPLATSVPADDNNWLFTTSQGDATALLGHDLLQALGNSEKDRDRRG